MQGQGVIVKNGNGTHNRVMVDAAQYLDGYRLRISFTDHNERVVDFSNFIQKKALGFLSKYKNTDNFRKFKIENGNVVWGKNWDLIFPIHQLYKGYID